MDTEGVTSIILVLQKKVVDVKKSLRIPKG